MATTSRTIIRVNPSFGTVEDFRLLLDEAHARGLRIITELVLNHTSDQNPWFQRARRAPVGSPERDFYVWSDDPHRYRDARIIFKDFETSNWTWDPVAKAYFWHRFYSHQPDLNFDNPAVHEELFRVMDFWLEMGVDGVRLDAVPYLYEREGTNCENLPETHAFLKKLRAHIDSKFTGRMLLAEANQWPEDAAAYFGAGDECHMNFHFPLMPRMFMALQMEDRYPIIDILEQTPAMPESCQWAIFLRNHDELTLEMVTDEERDYMYRVYAADPRARINLGIRRRLAPLLGNNRRKIELINSLLFSLPARRSFTTATKSAWGTTSTSAIAMACARPMQWSPDRNAGFSKANPQQLYLPTIHRPRVSLRVGQRREPAAQSLLALLVDAPAARGPAALRGLLRAAPSNSSSPTTPRSSPSCVARRRNAAHHREPLSFLASRGDRSFRLRRARPRGAFRAHALSRDQASTYGLHTCAARLLLAGACAGRGQAGPRKVSGRRRCSVERAAGRPRLVQRLEREVLPAYVPGCRWFGGKGRIVRDMRIVENVPLSSSPEAAHIVALEVAFNDGLPETYLLPLCFAEGETVERLASATPLAVVARFDGGRALCDAFHLPEARADLLRAVAQKGDNRGRTHLAGTGLPGVAEPALTKALASSRIVGADQSNTAIIYEDVGFLKFFRKFERGPHPDLDVTRFLGERGFPHVPSFQGALRLADTTGEGAVAMLVGFTQNQGDGWNYTLDALARFFRSRARHAHRDHPGRGSRANRRCLSRNAPASSASAPRNYTSPSPPETRRTLRLSHLARCISARSTKPCAVPRDASCASYGANCPRYLKRAHRGR